MDEKIFPKAMFVRRESNPSLADEEDGKDFLAYGNRDDAVDDDEDYTFVAEYHLHAVKKLKKSVVEAQ
ncbi:MAG: hypothetical protein LAN84_09755 [Acidobacteriia bacterium]|nr:hypothetical protein [Terriglobia bacterium]